MSIYDIPIEVFYNIFSFMTYTDVIKHIYGLSKTFRRYTEYYELITDKNNNHIRTLRLFYHKYPTYATKLINKLKNKQCILCIDDTNRFFRCKKCISYATYTTHCLCKMKSCSNCACTNYNYYGNMGLCTKYCKKCSECGNIFCYKCARSVNGIVICKFCKKIDL